MEMSLHISLFKGFGSFCGHGAFNIPTEPMQIKPSLDVFDLVS